MIEEDILIIGAGISGISAATHFRKHCPKRSFTILERRERIGGTWDLFRYPGIRSDSDMFSFGFKFKPWKNAHFFSHGPDIREYVHEAATENKVYDHIKFQRQVISADWDSSVNRWQVEVRDDNTGKTEHYSARFLLSCAGYYSYDNPYRPQFPGEEKFKGTIVHPQHWPENLDYSGKKVVVIGSGATAVTLIPSMAGKAAKVTMLQRSPSYIFSLPSVDPITKVLQATLPAKLAYKANRLRTIGLAHLLFTSCKNQPKLMRRFLISRMRAQLKGSPVDMKHFTPKYLPWDQRLCLVPDGDFFKALRGGKANVVTDEIDQFTEQGIRLKSGEELQADLIVTATGLNLQMFGGIALSVDGKPVELGKKKIYKSVLLEGLPNAAMVVGYTHASWTLKADLVSGYLCRLFNWMDKNKKQVVIPDGQGVAEVEGFTVLGGLNSGYIQRAANQLPRQGERHPWHSKQDYYHDSKVLLNEPVKDDALRFV